MLKQTAKWLVTTALAETVAGPVVGTLLNVAEIASWIHEYAPYLQAYLDEPKSLEELQQAVLDPKKGYDIHHIVEQTQAERDGFSRSEIDAPENLVRISTLKHWQITGWYMRKNPEFDDLSPRDYLRGRSWEDGQKVGWQALIDHGVLEP